MPKQPLHLVHELNVGTAGYSNFHTVIGYTFCIFSAKSTNMSRTEIVAYMRNTTVQQQFVQALLDDFGCVRDDLVQVVEDINNFKPFQGKHFTFVEHVSLFN